MLLEFGSIFSTIENEASRSGLKIISIFSNVANQIKAMFSQTTTVNFSNTFTQQLAADEMALMKYSLALKSGMTEQEAFDATMRNASVAAQQYAQTMYITGESVTEFTTRQKMDEIASMSQNKSFANVRSIINTYNGGLSQLGVTQQQFTQSVSQGNSVLGNYIASVGVGNATMRRYIGSLIATKAATIGLKVATIALNAVIGLGIGLLISFVTSALSAGWEKLKDAFKSTEERIADLNEKLKESASAIKTVSDSFRELKANSDSIFPRFVELAKGVDAFGHNVSLTDKKYKEFLELNNKIAEMFPELNMGMDSNGNAMLSLSYSADTLTDSLNALVEAERQAANAEIAKKMPETLESISEIEKEYNKEIKKINERKEEWTDTYNDILNRTLDTSVGRYSTIDAGGAAAMKQIEKAAALGMHGNVVYDNQQTTNNGYVFSIQWDYESVNMDDVKKLYDAKIEEESKLINNYENMIAAKWKEINPIISSWLQTDFLYNDLNDQMQEIANVMVSGLNFSELGLTTQEDVQNYVTNSVVRPLFLASDDVKDVFAEITDLQSQLKNGEITTEEFTSKVQNAFSNLLGSMDSTSVENFKNAFVSGFNQTENAGADFNTVLLGLIETWSSFSKLPDPAENFTGFSNLISSDKFTTETENYINSVEKLKSALNNLRKDELNPKTKFELFEQFPTLAAQTDNLDSAITNLIEDMSADIDSKIAELIKNAATEEDRIAFEAIRDILAEIGNVANDVTDKIATLSSTLDKVEKGKNILKSATEEMRENGEISQSTLKSIMELMEADENWVDYIKLENGQLKLNVDLWQEKIKDSLKLELKNFENELAILKKENDEIVKQIALFKTRKSVFAQETELTEQDSKLFMPSLLNNKRKGSLPDNINQNVLWSPFDEKLKKNVDDQKILKDSIEAIKALMDSYDKELDSIISGNDSDSSKSSDPKQYNWIETAIDRIKRKINSFANTVSSNFKTFSQRNNAAKEEISAITEEIELQQKAYEKYLKLADSVKLSESIKEKVRNGAIDISEYSDETAELIDKYKEWYEASLNAKDAIDELHDSLASLHDDEFNRIQKDFENRISLLEYLSNMYNTGISTLEASGYMASTEFYSALSSATEHNIELLKEELSSLESALQAVLDSGEIEKYSEAWYSYQITMNGVKESIAEATLSLAEFAKTMREIEWEYFDYLQDRISQIMSESKFLRELLGDDLFDESGNLTNNGMSVLGLRAMDYNVYMAQADKYAEEIKKIDKELANDPYNTDLIKRREELLALQQDMILAAEDEKQAMIDLVQDGIEAELSSLRDLIDAYKDALDSAKNLHDYQKKINDQTSNIAMLEKQFSMLQGDDSEENRANLQKIQDKLSQARDDLSETEYEYYITEQKKLLDNLYDKYELLLNQRIDDVDVLLSELISTVNTNSDTISQTLQITANNVGYTLTDNMRSIWQNTSGQLQGTLGSLQGVVSMYGENFNSQLTTTNNVLNNIASLISSMQSYSNNWSNGWIGSTNNSYIPDSLGWTPSNNNGYNDDFGDVYLPDNPTPSISPSPTPAPTPVKEITVGGRINAGNATIYRHESKSDGGNTQYYKNDPIYTVLSQSVNKFGELMLMVRHHSLSSGVTGYFRKADVKAYKHGGLVDETGLAWLDGTPQKPETVLNSDDTENLLEMLKYTESIQPQKLELASGAWTGIMPKINPIVPQFTNLQDKFDKISEIPSVVKNIVDNSDNGNEYNLDINIPIDHVENYEDFMDKMRDDPQFANMVIDMTLGRAFGGNSLSKNQYRWNRGR